MSIKLLFNSILFTNKIFNTSSVWKLGTNLIYNICVILCYYELDIVLVYQLPLMVEKSYIVLLGNFEFMVFSIF